ncbi:MAG: hypothetical protein ACJAT1_001000 [Marivirga sp.]|jgi:hypothetical protein
MLKRNFYIILTSLTILGYSWVVFHFVGDSHPDFTPCMFKSITSIPCPACGTSRSVFLIAEGAFTKAVQMNPLGYLVVSGLVILPFWLLHDLLSKKDTLFYATENFNKLAKQKPVLFTIFTLVIVNWIWNIFKAL